MLGFNIFTIKFKKAIMRTCATAYEAWRGELELKVVDVLLLLAAQPAAPRPRQKSEENGAT